MWKAEIRITLKEGVVDPQGKAVEKTLGELATLKWNRFKSANTWN